MAGSADSGFGKSVTRIPVTLLTGFLGAGKTTLLNGLLGQPELRGAAVLINELGDVGIDHHLVEMVDESLMLLDSGCLCCAMHGDLVKTLRSLCDKSSRREIPPVTRILIETTGLADPVPIVYTIIEHAFVSARYVLDGVITVVDATHGEDQIGQHQEALRQVSMADRLLITKCDLADRQRRASLSRRLSILNPAARQIETFGGRIPGNEVIGIGFYAPSEKSPDVATWLGELAAEASTVSSRAPRSPWIQRTTGERPAPDRSRHDGRVASFVVGFDQPVDWQGFTAAMGRILGDYGPQLLRVKGLIAVAGSERTPMVVHGVQGVAYPPLRLTDWPSASPFADRRGRLVFIGYDLTADDQAAIRGTLADIPNANAAARIIAANPLLPTRCWLSQRQAPAARSLIELDGWVVQAKRFSRTRTVP